jgi:hypothetical protein
VPKAAMLCSACRFRWKALLYATATLNNRLGDDSAIDLLFPGNLFDGELSLKARFHKELVLVLIYVTKFVCVEYEFLVWVRCIVLIDPPKTDEEIARFNTNKSADTNIPDIRSISIELILNITVFLDFLATRAIIELVTNLKTNQDPFSPCDIEVL